MTSENTHQLNELFAKLIVRDRHDLISSNFQHINQLQGQVEESLDLLNDAIEELRTIDPESVCTLKSLTLQIFDEEA